MENKASKSFTTKWFWLYRAFSYDFIFYYTIATLYYTTMKGFELSDVMLLHSITAISTFALLLPISWIIKKIGNTLSIRIGTFLWIVYMMGTILINNYYALMAIEVLCSIGTIFKILSDSVIIANTLDKHEQSEKYIKIESRGVTTHFIADCISALLAGILFEVNAQIPMILCLLVIAFSFILSLKIKDETESYKGLRYLGREPAIQTKQNEKFELKKFFKNKRVLSFLLFVVFFYGIIMSVAYMQTIGLVSMGMSATLIGVVLVVCRAVNAFASWLYGKIQHKIKKHFPLFMPAFLMTMTLVVGLLYTFMPAGTAKIVIICAVLVLIEFVKQPHKLYAKDYIRAHSSGQTRQNFYTIYFMCEMAGDFLLSLLGSIMLESLSVGYTYLIILATAMLPLVLSSVWLYKISSKQTTSTPKSSESLLPNEDNIK